MALTLAGWLMLAGASVQGQSPPGNTAGNRLTVLEDAHSFITELCVVHNCGSGTAAYVAEHWGRAGSPATPRASRSQSPASA
ncbi:hypothetical protein [Chloracidobacterium aggregatum]|uniref:hypothetical protein n=1 Tax=Chloracidobacterium aggregatum TaxID=2851959 RepID=UPI001B8B8E8E|nr:hypothetical protein J8C04_11540 [Chloracidobacterium sp. A]